MHDFVKMKILPFNKLPCENTNKIGYGGVMDDVFEALIGSYIENRIGIVSNFLTNNLANKLKDSLISLNKNSLLLAAGTGNSQNPNQNSAIRGDAIYWLDKNNNNQAEDEFFIQIENFIKYLNMSCYAGITDYEFHYTLYVKGSFYIKHIDQFKNDTSRAYSLISYLNIDWQPHDGGELLVYNNQNNNAQIIEPKHGTTVLFKSNEMPHEVLVTQKPRMSITGWLKK